MHTEKVKGDGTNESAYGLKYLVKRGMRFDDAREYIISEARLTVSNINEKERRQGYFGVKHTQSKTFKYVCSYIYFSY